MTPQERAKGFVEWLKGKDLSMRSLATGIELVIQAAIEDATLPLRAEIERLKDSPAMKWEADHQRRHLEQLGLADEFPFGCDAIEHVAEDLLAVRAENERLKLACERMRDADASQSIS